MRITSYSGQPRVMTLYEMAVVADEGLAPGSVRPLRAHRIIHQKQARGGRGACHALPDGAWWGLVWYQSASPSSTGDRMAYCDLPLSRQVEVLYVKQGNQPWTKVIRMASSSGADGKHPLPRP